MPRLRICQPVFPVTPYAEKMMQKIKKL